MAGTIQDQDFRTRIQRLETLIQEVERFADPTARDHTREMVQALLDLHGAGLEKILEQIAATGEAGLALIDALSRDDLIGSLLLLYGIHPLDLETRVRQALDEVRPALRTHGGNVQLLDVRDGVVRLRLEGNCNGCPSSAVTMRQTVEEAIVGKAPDLVALEVEGMAEAPPERVDGRARVALPML